MSLAELFARAGASDDDRDAWLAERRTGITATEVRDIALGRKRQQDLVDEKLGLRPARFGGNAFTAWGREREPFLSELGARRGIEPESRVFHSADNARWLASPDGIGVSFDGMLLVGEYKTSKHDLTPGSPEFVRAGYSEQVQWEMHVTGARRCLFIWEERLGDIGWFEPGDVHEHWIDYDPVTVERLTGVADRFLAALDARRAEVEAGAVSGVDDVLDELAGEVLAGRAEEAAGKRRREAAWEALQAALTDREGLSQRSNTALLTWIPAEPKTVTETITDVEAAVAAYPDDWQALVDAEAVWGERILEHTTTREVTVPGKPVLKVTRQKSGDTE